LPVQIAICGLNVHNNGLCNVNLNDLRFFVHAVDFGGFAAAGRRLGCPKSTVSKRVAELEAALGVRLVQRTSRSFVLTDVGEKFYEHARATMIEAEAAESFARSRLAEPSGIVNLTASVPSAQFRLADQLPLLAQRYPKILIRLHATDRFVDLVREGFDIAVRSHTRPLPDSDLVQKQIRVDPIILVASPAYLWRRGLPNSPADLANHDGFFATPLAKVWNLNGPDGAEMTVAPIPRLLADESIVLLRSAEAALGIAPIPRAIAAPSLRTGSLCHVLPDWHCGTVTTTILTPHRRGQLPAVRTVIDFLAQGQETPGPGSR
jgi:DNA-binding transcriptional LysR family regulator